MRSEWMNRVTTANNWLLSIQIMFFFVYLKRSGSANRFYSKYTVGGVCVMTCDTRRTVSGLHLHFAFESDCFVPLQASKRRSTSAAYNIFV